VFAQVPFRTPSQLTPLLDAGARVRHLSSGWALVEIAAADARTLSSRSRVLAAVRPDYHYAWTTLPTDLEGGAELVWEWGAHGLVGMPEATAWRLPRIGSPHHSVPLGDIAREALADAWEFHAPAISRAGVDAARAAKEAFDIGRWSANVAALADNEGLRSRFAFRVRDVEIFDGSERPDDAADVAADWLLRELRSYGYDVAAEPFLHTRFATLNQKFADFHMRNVVAEKPGQGPNRHRTLLLTAHYDSIASRTEGWEDDWRDMPAPGANDNASGVATVLEAARIFQDIEFDFTVRFVLFSGEELGLFGSRHYARAARDAGEDIIGVLNMDMIGHEADGVPDLHVIANHQSEWLLREAEAVIAQLDTPLTLFPAIAPDIVFSDHAPFWAQGYSALAFSEEDALETPEFSPVYHQSEDTPEHINTNFAAETASAIIAVAAAVARPLADAPSDGAADHEPVRVIGASAFPNPFVTGAGRPISIQYQLSRDADVRLAVYGVGGRRVFSASFEAGSERGNTGLNAPVVWHGRNQHGAPVAPGLYMVHIAATDDSGAVSQRPLRVLVAADESVLDGFRGPLSAGP
jgi:hypothetical protein